MAASAKKYQDVDLYALLGVNADANEKEVSGEKITYSRHISNPFIRHRFAKHTGRKPSTAIQTRIRTTQRPQNSFMNCPRRWSS